MLKYTIIASWLRKWSNPFLKQYLFQSLEDKLNGKISAIKSDLLYEIYDSNHKWKVLQENYFTENLDSNEKEEICSLKRKIKTLEIENGFFKNDIDSKKN